ncbi:MAG: DUF362 domain-containing protein [Candidatus Magnetoovum sp. WYHC-5]|nr:DUF362 domain-containing protein [Candidatus Magnetoovum sp. WYHC-5]
MAKVFIKSSSYEYDELRENVLSLLSDLEQWQGVSCIKPGKRVLVKPNLLMGVTPERAIVTHPMIIKIVCEYALSKGANVLVSDSPALGRFEKVVKQSGLLDALSGMGVTLKEFSSSRKVNNGTFTRLEIAADALDCDVIINIPKLKTHVQMGMTLAIKNLFGTVVGFQKSGWHFNIGENGDKFAELLVNIYTTLRPTINILDGVLALEGDGPGTSGKPRHIGVLMASADALSVDLAVCEMLAVNPFWLPTNRVGRNLGLIDDYSVEGQWPTVEGFVLPKNKNIVFGPNFAKNFVRKNFTSRPQNISLSCKLCNECVNICPAKAIDNLGNRLSFDYQKCIRCYCCLEVCPHQAIKIHEPLVGKIVQKLL